MNCWIFYRKYQVPGLTTNRCFLWHICHLLITFTVWYIILSTSAIEAQFLTTKKFFFISIFLTFSHALVFGSLWLTCCNCSAFGSALRFLIGYNKFMLKARSLILQSPGRTNYHLLLIERIWNLGVCLVLIGNRM